MSDDAVFRALADPSRRELLDRLRDRDGRTSQDLCRGLAMSRQAVAKHLSILEEAGLVSARWKGREKLHFVNTTPIADVTEGWMARFRRPLPPLASLRNENAMDEGTGAADGPTIHQGTTDRGRLPSLKSLVRSQDDSAAVEDASPMPAKVPAKTASVRPVSPYVVPGLRALRNPEDQ